MYAVNVYQKCVISRVCNHKSMCASLSLSLRRYVDPHVQKPTHQTNVPSRIRGETHYLSIDLSINMYIIIMIIIIIIIIIIMSILLERPSM